MTETTESPQPSEPPPDPAPRPGMRLAPPGAAPTHPEPGDTTITAPLAEAETPEPQPVSRPRARKKPAAGRRAAGSARRSKPASPGPASPPTSSSTGFSDDDDLPPPAPQPPPVFVENEQLRTDLRELLLTASVAANNRFGVEGTPQWVASEDEADGVARPAARVIVRHMPAGIGGGGNPDLTDAIAAAITLVRYGGRQIRLWFEIRRLKTAKATAAEAQHTEEAPAA